MNEKLVEQVLQIEKQAQEISNTAVREAEQLPILAEQEARALIDKARTEAQEEARRLVANAQAQEDSARIQAEAETRVNRTKSLSAGHLDRAVAFVIDRVTGKE